MYNLKIWPMSIFHFQKLFHVWSISTGEMEALYSSLIPEFIFFPDTVWNPNAYSENSCQIWSISTREMGPLVILANPGVHIHPGICTVLYWGYDPKAYWKNRNGELSYVGMIHYSCPISRFDQYPYFISKNYLMSGAYPQGKWEHFNSSIHILPGYCIKPKCIFGKLLSNVEHIHTGNGTTFYSS